MFLSHLSGDEVLKMVLVSASNFLSHLSGDEELQKSAKLGNIFLSHLSGDEDWVYWWQSFFWLSKSPER